MHIILFHSEGVAAGWGLGADAMYLGLGMQESNAVWRNYLSAWIPPLNIEWRSSQERLMCVSEHSVRHWLPSSNSSGSVEHCIRNLQFALLSGWVIIVCVCKWGLVMDARLCLWSLFLLTYFPFYGIFSCSTEGRLVSLCWVWPVEPEQLGSLAGAFCVGSCRVLEFSSHFPIFLQPRWAAFWSHHSRLQAPPPPRPAATSAAGFGARLQAWKTASSPGGELGSPCCEGHPGGPQMGGRGCP